ncbi:MAG: 30S ribosome-binding factor RbfA [Candidatus Lernaella stagnicola]|nr:30S ribosome-binding factor RbfA [Candidatus Lernaella stagnicola]
MAEKRAFKRAHRVGEEVHKAISLMLIDGELRDPRLALCTITTVEMSDDLRHGKVFFSLIGDENAKQEAERSFKRAAGFIRKEVSRRLQLRFAPELRFFFDQSMERASRLSELLKHVDEVTTPETDDDDD